MNSRSAQLLAAGLGFVLVVLVGAVIFILLSRPAQGPPPSPSSSAIANVSPSASALPTFSFSPFPTTSQPPSASPTQNVVPTAPPTAPPTALTTLPPTLPATLPPTLPPTVPATASPPPTPTAPPIPVAAGRQLRVTDLGLDARDLAAGGVERLLVFTTDGPTIVRAEIADATARTRVCLWQTTEIAGRVCDTFRNGVIEFPVFDSASRGWTLSLIGANETSAPTVDLTLDFNAHAPLVDFSNLRYQGAPSPAYNGINVSLDTLGVGQLSINGEFDPGQLHHYHVLISEAGIGPVNEQPSPGTEPTPPPVPSFSVIHDVTSVTTYLVAVTNPNAAGEPAPVFLHLIVGWP